MSDENDLWDCDKKINNKIVLFSDETFELGKKQDALKIQNKSNLIILDLVCQACDYDYYTKIINNLCISAYEEACDYLKEQGILKKINPHTYKIIKELEECEKQ